MTVYQYLPDGKYKKGGRNETNHHAAGAGAPLSDADRAALIARLDARPTAAD
jgi:hypothetical protein